MPRILFLIQLYREIINRFLRGSPSIANSIYVGITVNKFNIPYFWMQLSDLDKNLPLPAKQELKHHELLGSDQYAFPPRSNSSFEQIYLKILDGLGWSETVAPFPRRRSDLNPYYEQALGERERF